MANPDPLISALRADQEAARISDVALAHESGVSRITLQRWWKGEGAPKLPVIRQVERALAVLIARKKAGK